MSKKEKEKLSPFEQNKENIKAFADNINLYQSALLLVEAAKTLGFSDGEPEFDELEEMLNATIAQFSQFLEERGDSWN